MIKRDEKREKSDQNRKIFSGFLNFLQTLVLKKHYEPLSPVIDFLIGLKRFLE